MSKINTLRRQAAGSNAGVEAALPKTEQVVVDNAVFVEDEAVEATSTVGNAFTRRTKVAIRTQNKDALAIKKLMDNGDNVTRLKAAVRDVVFNDKLKNAGFTITLDREVYAISPDDNDEMIGISAVTLSVIDLRAVCRRDAKASFLMSGMMQSEIEEMTETFKRVLIGSTLDIIQLFVPAGTEYINPFASNAKVNVWADNKIINHFVDFKPGQLLADTYDKHI